MSTRNDEFIPVLRFKALTKYFDLFYRIVLPEETLREGLLRHCAIEPGQRVLEIACGTGSLLQRAKVAHPTAHFTGLDIDPEVLSLARQKLENANLDVRLDQASATALPYEDGSFDQVISMMAWHHLATEDKQQAFREVFRVLRPGGTFCVEDIAPPDGVYARATSFIMRHVEEMRDNIDGRLPGWIEAAGFDGCTEEFRCLTIFGTVRLWKGTRP